MKNQLAIVVIFTAFFSSSQVKQESYKIEPNSPDWIQYMYGETVSLYQLRDLYDAYYATHAFEKTQHTQYFKRLLKDHWTELDENGFLLESTKAKPLALAKSPTSSWQEIGPWDYDHEQAMTFEVQSPGSSHVYTVEQSPADPNLVYAGTATAGLWKSTDKGMNWVLVTRDMDVNSVYAIALDPSNTSIVYFGEGDGKIWKSIDAGLTWNMTGDATFQTLNSFVRDMKFIGVNTLLAATDNGLFRSVDGGANWTNVQGGEHMEIEIKPNDSAVLYTVKLAGNVTEFYKSIDNGLTWVLKPIGWPAPAGSDEQKRCEIAVSAANPDLITVLASGDVGVDGGLYGIYKSIDAGETFTFECCEGSPGGAPTVTNPNILGWSEDGTGDGGQYYYDLALGSSPTDPDRMFAAGINVWRSLNGGNDWTINGHWVSWVQSGSLKHRYSHADVHDIKFFENGASVDMWVASDGGLFYSSTQGDTLEPRMHGIHGTDFWGFGAGFKDGYVMVGGTYHNGTLIRYNDIYKGGIVDPTMGGWLAELGGDNYRGFVNYADNTIGYADNGSFNFSPIREERMSGRSFQSDKKCNTSYVSGEYGTYGFSPTIYTTFYSPVGTELYKTINGGTSFSLVHDFGGNKLIQVHVAWNDPQTIYVTHKVASSNYQILRSNDGGATWTNCNPSSVVTSGNSNRVKYIELDDEDPNKLWCILMGAQFGNKVFQSIDGGLNWTNITAGPTINNENVRSISHHYGTEDGLYLGTTKHMYYKNASMSDWVLFSNDLPASTNCQFTQPYYGEGKIRTASQRGVYECDFYENAPPVAMISANTQDLNLAANCLADTIHFVDHSTVRAASATWAWTFEGGTPATSNLENPKIVYSSPGIYDVELIVTDTYGSDTVQLLNFITVTNSYNYTTITEDFNGPDFPPLDWKLSDSEGSSWQQDWPLNDITNHVAGYPNYWVDATGEQHLLIMPALNLSLGITSALSWDYTYNDNNSYTDSLAVVYRTGTNPTWQTIWVKGGSNLESPGTQTWFWDASTPTITWQNGYIDLSFLLGESCVELAFDNRGEYGNHIWIDNVNLFATYDFSGIVEEALDLRVSPNPSTGKFTISGSTEMKSYVLTDVAGRVISRSEKVNSTFLYLDLTHEPSGLYFLKATTDNASTTVRLMKE